MSEEYKILEGLHYTQEHEWAKKQDDGNVVIGVTDYAQKQLHEIVFVELPELGTEAGQMDAVGALESVKAVSDMNCPVSGEVIEVNEALLDNPELINEDPYGEGWIAKIKPSNLEADLANLMEFEPYTKFVAEAAH